MYNSSYEINYIHSGTIKRIIQNCEKLKFISAIISAKDNLMNNSNFDRDNYDDAVILLGTKVLHAIYPACG